MTHIIRRENFFAPFEQMINKVYDDIASDSGLQALRNYSRSSHYPKLDVLTFDNRYVIEAAIPGVKPEDIKVEILPYEGGQPSSKMLKISGKMSRDYQYSNTIEYSVKELRRSFFERSMLLPDDLEGDPEAVIDNGILRMTWGMPKSMQPTKAKLIDVKKV